MRFANGLTLGAIAIGALGAVWAQNMLPQMSIETWRAALTPAPKQETVRVAEISAPQIRNVVSDAAPASAITESRNDAPAASAPAPAPVKVAQAAPAPAPKAEAKPAPTKIACDKPGALGVSRVVEVDTTGGPGFGFEHFKMHDFLREKEVVLTFDDGPWPNNTPAVLKALANECVKAIFFPIGKHATYYPEILKLVIKDGHSVGSHTWSHANLNRVKGDDKAIEEIEKGFSAVRFGLDTNPSPFFRFPALQHPPAMVKYLGERNVGIFSTDLDSFDFKTRKAEQVIKNVMAKLEKHGKGIVLMHDFQHVTAEALPELLAQMKAGGYKIVHMKAKASLTTIAKFDEELKKDVKLPTVSSRPTTSVIQTISE